MTEFSFKLTDVQTCVRVALLRQLRGGMSSTLRQGEATWAPVQPDLKDARRGGDHVSEQWWQEWLASAGR